MFHCCLACAASCTSLEAGAGSLAFFEALCAGVPPRRSLWSSLVEAVRGSHQDYTAGSLNRAILLLAVPMVLEMVLESLFAVVDVLWVGRLGANAVATVGL